MHYRARMLRDKPQTARASDENNNDVLLEKNDNVLCLVSFQSTGVTNISSVNALSSVELYVWERRKGRGIQKMRWVD